MLKYGVADRTLIDSTFVDDVQSIFTKRAVKLGDATAFKELSFTDFLHSMALITVSFRSASLGLPI